MAAAAAAAKVNPEKVEPAKVKPDKAKPEPDNAKPEKKLKPEKIEHEGSRTQVLARTHSGSKSFKYGSGCAYATKNAAGAAAKVWFKRHKST